MRGLRYYIADLHFFHGALNDRMDRRGFADTEAMNAYMLERWNGLCHYRWMRSIEERKYVRGLFLRIITLNVLRRNLKII